MRICLSLLVVLLLVSCQEPYEKAVIDYIQENFNDPGSYECVDLSKPQVFTPTTMYMEYLDGIPSDSIAPRLEAFRKEMEEKGSDPDVILYYTLEHKYRSANENGALMLHEETWYLSEDQTRIFNIEPK